MRNKLAVLGLIIIIFFVLLAVLRPYLTPHDPYDSSFMHSLEEPSREYLLGRDNLGRDVLSRIIHGARISLSIGLISVAIGLIIGVPIGAISGYYGGLIDLISQRFVDIMMAFPGMLLSIIIVSIMGGGLRNAMIAVGVVSIPIYIRLVRGSVLSIKNKEYIESAKALGANDFIIIFKHILPNVLLLLLFSQPCKLQQPYSGLQD